MNLSVPKKVLLYLYSIVFKKQMLQAANTAFILSH